MTDLAHCRAIINVFLSGRAPPPLGPEQPYAPPTPPPPVLKPDTWRQIAAALLLLTSHPPADDDPQDDDPRAIGEAILARRRVIDEFNKRLASGEDWATVTVPPPATFTGLALAAWCHALLKRGLVDADALLLAALIWLRLGRATGRDTHGAMADFLLYLARADGSPDSAAQAMALINTAPKTPPRRRRPKGPSKKTLAYVAKRREAVRARAIDREPWALLDGLAAEIENQIAIDDSTKSDVSKSRSGTGQHWYGNPTRHLPSLRRYYIIEAIADHCTAWWLAAFQAETTAPD